MDTPPAPPGRRDRQGIACHRQIWRSRENRSVRRLRRRGRLRPERLAGDLAHRQSRWRRLAANHVPLRDPCVSTRTVPPNGRLGGQRRLAAGSNRWIVMSLRWGRERGLAGLRGVDPHAANRATGFVRQRSTEGVDLGGQLSASVAGVNDAARLQQSAAVSTSALGQCSAPRGMTRSSRGLSAPLPSRIWIFSSPSTTRKDSSVSGCLCQVNSP
jgi:hypothetical protein